MPASDYLSPAEVAEFRALVEGTYPDTYEVLRDTDTPDDTGGWTTAETVSSTGACRLRPLGESAQETIVAERLEWQVAYSIDLPYGADVTPRDRLRVNGTRTFEIGGIVRGGAWGFWATAVCRETG